MYLNIKNYPIGRSESISSFFLSTSSLSLFIDLLDL